MNSAAATNQRQNTKRTGARGLAQHSLVEHSLCLLDSRSSLLPGTKHSTAYQFTDRNRNRKTANVSVHAANGLNANDEMLLNGLLSLTFSQPDATIDFYATPYWCMKQLGIIGKDREQGYRFEQFRSSLERLAGVTYQNDWFYDPIRGEHRDVMFGFIKYSLPLNSTSRAWRFVWDPQFFQYCQTIKGSFQFDFEVYRQLDPASRRLFLLLNKIFHRNDVSPNFDVRSLAVNTIGFSPTMRTSDLKQKLLRTSNSLLKLGLIKLPDYEGSLSESITKEAPGKYNVRFHRGEKAGLSKVANESSLESPLTEPLMQLGFDDVAIQRILNQFSRTLIQQWIDITQAADEQNRIKTSPQAFFTHYITEANEKRTTPPDWWRKLQKKEFNELQASRKQQSNDSSQTFEGYLAGAGREFFEATVANVFANLKSAGQDESDARANADYHARVVARKQFAKESNPFSSGSMHSIQDIINKNR